MMQHDNPRLPQNRYIGDGVYAAHDGYQFILETSDGISVTNRIGLEPQTMRAMDRYREYAEEFYRELRGEAKPAEEEPAQD